MKLYKAAKIILRHGILSSLSSCWVTSTERTGTASIMDMLTPESAGGQYSASPHLMNRRRRRGYDKPLKPSNKDLFAFAYPEGWKRTEEII